MVGAPDLYPRNPAEQAAFSVGADKHKKKKEARHLRVISGGQQANPLAEDTGAAGIFNKRSEQFAELARGNYEVRRQVGTQTLEAERQERRSKVNPEAFRALLDKARIENAQQKVEEAAAAPPPAPKLISSQKELMAALPNLEHTSGLLSDQLTRAFIKNQDEVQSLIRRLNETKPGIVDARGNIIQRRESIGGRMKRFFQRLVSHESTISIDYDLERLQKAREVEAKILDPERLKKAGLSADTLQSAYHALQSQREAATAQATEPGDVPTVEPTLISNTITPIKGTEAPAISAEIQDIPQTVKTNTIDQGPLDTQVIRIRKEPRTADRERARALDKNLADIVRGLDLLIPKEDPLRDLSWLDQERVVEIAGFVDQIDLANFDHAMSTDPKTVDTQGAALIHLLKQTSQGLDILTRTHQAPANTDNLQSKIKEVANIWHLHKDKQWEENVGESIDRIRAQATKDTALEAQFPSSARTAIWEQLEKLRGRVELQANTSEYVYRAANGDILSFQDMVDQIANNTNASEAARAFQLKIFGEWWRKKKGEAMHDLAEKVSVMKEEAPTVSNADTADDEPLVVPVELDEKDRPEDETDETPPRIAPIREQRQANEVTADTRRRFAEIITPIATDTRTAESLRKKLGGIKSTEEGKKVIREMNDEEVDALRNLFQKTDTFAEMIAGNAAALMNVIEEAGLSSDETHNLRMLLDIISNQQRFGSYTSIDQSRLDQIRMALGIAETFSGENSSDRRAAA